MQKEHFLKQLFINVYLSNNYISISREIKKEVCLSMLIWFWCVLNITETVHAVMIHS